MPPAVIGAVAIAGSIASGVAGKEAGRGAAGDAHDAANIAFQKLQDIGLPPDQSKAIIMQQFQQKGLMTPELEQHIDQQASGMANVQGSPEAQKAQMQALQILQQRGQTGLTPEDRSALNQIRQQIATDTEAKRQQIMQNFAARGQGGSGAELIAALQGSQSGANAESQQGDRLAAMASQNALQSIGQAGTLGGQIQQQQFGEQAQKAQAQDVINQFNTANQIGQQARNIGAQNAAQQSNLANSQNIANANTQQGNNELLRQSQAQRQNWLDQVQRAQIQSGGATQNANYNQQLSQQQSASAAAPYAAIGAGAMTMLGSSLMGGSKTPKASGGYSGSDPMAGATQVAYNGGEIKKYNEGGDVKPEPSFAEKLANYFSSNSNPYEELAKKGISASDLAAGAKSTGLANGGNVEDPQFMKLKKMFPHSSPEVLRDIHAKSNPSPMGSAMVPPAPVPMMPKVMTTSTPQGYGDGGGVHQIDEHQRRLGVTDYRKGGHVPGQAPVPGDSPKNDIVDAKLSPGEFVIKRSQAKSPFGQKLIKLLQAHDAVMKHAKDDGQE